MQAPRVAVIANVLTAMKMELRTRLGAGVHGGALCRRFEGQRKGDWGVSDPSPEREMWPHPRSGGSLTPRCRCRCCGHAAA